MDEENWYGIGLDCILKSDYLLSMLVGNVVCVVVGNFDLLCFYLVGRFYGVLNGVLLEVEFSVIYLYVLGNVSGVCNLLSIVGD